MAITCIEYDSSMNQVTPEGLKLGFWLHWKGRVGRGGDRVGVRGQVMKALAKDIAERFPHAVVVKDRDGAVKALMDAGELDDMIHPMAPSHL